MAKKRKPKSRDEFTHSLYLLTRLVFYLMLMLAGDVAFSQYKDQKLGLKIDLLTERIEQQNKKIGQLETEVLVLGGLKTAREEYFDERLDKIEMFLSQVKGFKKEQTRREYINEARIEDLKDELTK